MSADFSLYPATSGSGVTEKILEQVLMLYYAIITIFIAKKEVSREVKMGGFKQYLSHHGSESGVLTKRLRSEVQSIEIKCFRRVIAVTRRDRLKNATIREELNVG